MMRSNQVTTLASLSQPTLRVSDLVANPSRTAARRSLRMVKKNTKIPRAGEKISSPPSIKRMYAVGFSRVGIMSSSNNDISTSPVLLQHK